MDPYEVITSQPRSWTSVPLGFRVCKIVNHEGHEGTPRKTEV